MNKQPSIFEQVNQMLFGSIRSFARSTDPETSHEAAARATRINLCALEILELMKDGQKRSDEMILEFFGSERWSDTALRHARLALQRSGLIYDTGECALTKRKRRTILWQITEAKPITFSKEDER